MYTLVFQYSWYFFEALVKSMAQFLMESGKVKVNIIICLSQNYLQTFQWYPWFLLKYI